MEYKVKINGMHCEKCKARILSVLKANGFSKASIDLESGIATVRKFGKIDTKAVNDAISDAGFGVETLLIK